MLLKFKVTCFSCKISISHRKLIVSENLPNIMTEDKSDTKVDLGLLEEDDEFEEFPVDSVKAAEEDKEANVWEDNWDDDNVEDDFANQLR